MEKNLRTGNAYGTAPKGLKLPDTVYRQALWAARDLPRLHEKLAEMEEACDALYAADPSRQRVMQSGCIHDVTGRKAAELAQLSQRVQAMEEAFGTTPDKYLGVPYPETFHRNTWKRWQKIVVYQLAANLKIL